MVKLPTYAGSSDVVGWSSMDCAGRTRVGADGGELAGGDVAGLVGVCGDAEDPDDPEPVAAAAPP
jgi:hypothetical protein